MTQAKNPQTPSETFLRRGGTPEQTITDLGPLAHLVGTWVGNKGLNLVAVPEPLGKAKFTLLHAKYMETLTFTPVGAPVPNRSDGSVPTEQVGALEYQLRIVDVYSNETLHAENGMWLYLGSEDSPATIARQAAIPHGDSVLALGDYKNIEGPPTIPDINVLPQNVPANIPLGYTDPYGELPKEFKNPNHSLQEVINNLNDQKIIKTLTLDVSTDPLHQLQGGILNIPFISRYAKTTAFKCTYWIETVQDIRGGKTFQQLQYSQQTNINFLKGDKPNVDDGLIMWPHVNVNTLIKQ